MGSQTHKGGKRRSYLRYGDIKGMKRANLEKDCVPRRRTVGDTNQGGRLNVTCRECKNPPRKRWEQVL